MQRVPSALPKAVFGSAQLRPFALPFAICRPFPKSDSESRGRSSGSLRFAHQDGGEEEGMFFGGER